MRSSRSAPDPLDPGPKGFAHRGLHDGATFIENSLTAFAAALELGAGIECDVRLTADGQVVVFHDADAQRLCGSPAVIARSTLADLSRFTVGNRPIPTLGQLLRLVDGRVPILIEAKVDDRFWRFGPALLAALAGYGGRFGVMSHDPRLPRWLKTNAPRIRRGLVIADEVGVLRRRIALWLADPDFVAVERHAPGSRWAARLRAEIPVYSWTIATREQRETAAVHADALIWEADGRP